MEQKTSNKSGPNKNDYNMGFGHNEADRYKKEMKAYSVQSKEFTDALNFVLNYRESMEGMDGYIPSSDLAEMLIIYTQSTIPKSEILKIINSISHKATSSFGGELDYNIIPQKDFEKLADAIIEKINLANTVDGGGVE